MENQTMKIKMTITIELDEDLYPNTEDVKLWLENEVFVPDDMVLHSNEIGDEVGVVKSIKNIQYL